VFTVEDPWYRKPWFYASSAAAFAVLLVVAHRTRLRLALDLERQRTQIAMDLHDEIGSGLGSIGILAGIAGGRSHDPTTRTLLGDIGDTAGELSTSLGDIVWSLRPGSRTLQELLERIAERGQRLFPDESTSVFVCDFPEMTDPVVLELNVRRNVLLIVAEALHNAATHAGARRVDVLVTPDLQGWRIRVSDDGRGFHPLSASRSGGGLGLNSMRRRAAEIGADLDVRGAPGGGTTVSLRFHPLGRQQGRSPN
jgi:signal transduction histidine kinase